MAVDLTIKIDDSGATKSGSPSGGAPGGGNGRGGGGAGGGGVGEDGPLTPAEALRQRRRRLLGRAEDGNFNNPLAVGRTQVRQRLNRLRSVTQNRERTDRQQQQNELTLIRVQRAAERKLQQQRAARERAAERDRKQKERQQEMAKRRAAKEQASAAQGKQQRNAQLAQIAVTAARGGDSRFAQAGAGLGAVIGTALGGPVGAVVGQVVGEMVGERLDDPLKELTTGLRVAGAATRFAGRQMEMLARNDGLGMIADTANTAAEALGEIPVVGRVMSEQFRLLGSVASATRGVLGAFNDRAREISGFNGPLASAVARQNVERMKIDIREAQRAGDGYAQIVEAVTRLERTVAAFAEPVKQGAGVVLPAVLNAFLDNIERTYAAYDRITGHLTPLTEILRVLKKESTPVPGDVVDYFLAGLNVPGGIPGGPAPPSYVDRNPGKSLPPILTGPM